MSITPTHLNLHFDGTELAEVLDAFGLSVADVLTCGRRLQNLLQHCEPTRLFEVGGLRTLPRGSLAIGATPRPGVSQAAKHLALAADAIRAAEAALFAISEETGA